jgi:phage shock protein PspC (stress-responsive transcriptional regulator)
MKKTLTVNISGIVFHIDEDAYEQLNHYLSSLKKHFGKDDDCEEIIADIENRMAELLQQRTNETKQVITLADIKEVIALLGQPFEMDDEAEGEKGRPRYSIKAKRLFRDPDNRALAGVAAGLAAYFGVDIILFRILFIVLFFASGAGLLIYIILWIVMPEALTTSEKLQMRGKPVNISNIEESVKREVETVKSKLEGFAEEARASYHSQKHHMHKASNSVIDVLVKIVTIFARIVGLVAGIVLLLVGLGLLIGFGAMFIGWDGFSFFEGGQFVHISFSTLTEWLLASPLAISMAPVALFLFFGIPLVMLIYTALRLLIGQHFRIPRFGNTLGLVWIASLIGLIVITIDTFSDFKHKSGASQTTSTIFLDEGQVLHLATSPVSPKIIHTNTIHLFDNKFFVEHIHGGELLYAYPKLEVFSSKEPHINVWVNPMASGYSLEAAIDRAESIQYKIVTTASTIEIPSHFSFDAQHKIRNQQVHITIRLPIGQIVYFNENMKELLRNNPNRYWKGSPFAGNYWVMTEKGLKMHKNSGDGHE